MNDQNRDKLPQHRFSRRSVLGIGSAALAAIGFAGLTANAQEKASTQKAEHDGKRALGAPGGETGSHFRERPSIRPGAESKPLKLVRS
ncbi:MAG: hypothetical protein JWO91_715 [Acidobacteriaceae bacterium]|jgi:oxalate decarboxylase|nr:hypothetical protein [Acidobacteriaceae bacterium]